MDEPEDAGFEARGPVLVWVLRWLTAMTLALSVISVAFGQLTSAAACFASALVYIVLIVVATRFPDSTKPAACLLVYFAAAVVVVAFTLGPTISLVAWFAVLPMLATLSLGRGRALLLCVPLAGLGGLAVATSELGWSNAVDPRLEALSAVLAMATSWAISGHYRKRAAIIRAEQQRVYGQLQAEMLAHQKTTGELQHAQKLESVAQLSAGIAHEINTPLQFVGDNLSFLREALSTIREAHKTTQAMLLDERPDYAERLADLREDLDLDFIEDEAEAAWDRTSEGVHRVTEIVRAMKGFARVADDTARPFDLNEALRDTVLITRHQTKRIAQVVLELGDIPLVECLGGELNQVFLNLIINATHAIEAAHPDASGRIEIRTRAMGHGVEVTIADNGCGIPASIKHRVFDPFFTTKDVGKGTGQGLAISRNVVESKHQGRLWFEDLPTGGTVFHLFIPSTFAQRAA